MSRDEALAALEGIAYGKREAADDGHCLLLKKMGWSREKLDSYIARPAIAHDGLSHRKAPLGTGRLMCIGGCSDGKRACA
jgi:hypothetical protein